MVRCRFTSKDDIPLSGLLSHIVCSISHQRWTQIAWTVVELESIHQGDVGIKWVRKDSSIWWLDLLYYAVSSISHPRQTWIVSPFIDLKSTLQTLQDDIGIKWVRKGSSILWLDLLSLTFSHCFLNISPNINSNHFNLFWAGLYLSNLQDDIGNMVYVSSGLVKGLKYSDFTYFLALFRQYLIKDNSNHFNFSWSEIYLSIPTRWYRYQVGWSTFGYLQFKVCPLFRVLARLASNGVNTTKQTPIPTIWKESPKGTNEPINDLDHLT